MSGASRACCYVCAEPGLTVESDWMDGTLMERTEFCQRCRLYHYEYATGNSTERVGFHEFWRDWRETQDETRDQFDAYTQQRMVVVREARAMWNDPTVRPFLDGWLEDPNDAAPLLVLADFLDERGLYPAQSRGIRDLYGVPAR